MFNMHNEINAGEKQAELNKYRALVLAAIDYSIMMYKVQPSAIFPDWEAHFNGLKIQVEEHFNKGRLTRLKQWFRDISEIIIECRDLKFNSYLKEKTNYDVNVFKAYNDRVDKIIAKGKIGTDNQFYDIQLMVDNLCQTEPPDTAKINLLNKLLGEYETRKGE